MKRSPELGRRSLRERGGWFAGMRTADLWPLIQTANGRRRVRTLPIESGWPGVTPGLLLPTARALSIFNMVALVWLGLTVLLNAERRTPGAWLAGSGLILGGLFFAGHSAVVGREMGTFTTEMEFWWHASWVPLVAAPYLWYVVMAWYDSANCSAARRSASSICCVAEREVGFMRVSG